MDSNVVKIWFSNAYQQMDDVADACLLLRDESGESFGLVESTSEEFGRSTFVHENIQAVVNRRKSIVTQTAAQQQLLNQQAQSSAAVQNNVADIGAKNYLVTAPLIIEKQIIGVVCFEFKYERGSQSQDYLSQVESSIAWLACLPQLPIGTGTQHSVMALKITATALSQSESSEAAMAVTSELANKLQCTRVSIGYVEHHDVHLHAISNSSSHETRQNVVKHIEHAMLEAIDQKEVILYPPEPKSYYRTQDHDVLVRRHTGEFICTVPMVVDEKVIGAIMFERQGEAGEFDGKTKELCETLVSLFAPILQYRRLNDRHITEKLKESARGLLAGVLGSDYLGVKFISAFMTVCLLFAFFMNWEYKISANTILEGAIERVITSPEDGYIKQASARPGDVVEAGAELAVLDNRDLTLEKLKWAGKQKQVSKEYREALALHDLSQIGILRAQLSQAEAQLEILQQKLSRTVISAPIAGVVVSGDYTRALGSPVERGQVLYKVSPLDDYRIVLQVDESDVSEIAVGMHGELTLSAAAEETFEMEVAKITPVATAENGINYYQVEASLKTTPEFLRPGMQGVGKIHVGDRQLLWIWTHKMTEWISLKLWAWW